MTAATSTQRQKALALLKRHGIMRLSDFMAHGVHQPTLARLADQGEVVRPSRGLYELRDAEIALSHNFAAVAKRVLRGVICLISALQYHEITLQMSNRVWLAIGESDRKPQLDYPIVRVVRFGAKAIGRGVQTHEINGVSVRIFDPAKTVVDCFRYRNTVGLDVALEGMRMALRGRKATPDAIADHARALRIWSVLRPYLEAAVADEG